MLLHFDDVEPNQFRLSSEAHNITSSFKNVLVLKHIFEILFVFFLEIKSTHSFVFLQNLSVMCASNYAMYPK